MAAAAEASRSDRYLFIVGDFEWTFDDFLTGYEMALQTGKGLRRMRIRPNGLTTVMRILTSGPHTYDSDQTFSVESPDLDYGRGPC